MALPVHLGKYQIDRRLGGGGMAEVYQARVLGAAGFSRPVAIKRVLPGFADNPTLASLFVGEAQLSARLSHPNVVSVLDFDRDPEQGMFLVMELVEGRDLHQLLSTGLLPVSVTIYLVIEILRGLGYAHDLPGAEPGVRGLVHRDVSPHNVLLSWEGAVKVSDFGIAKARASANASASAVIKGKAAYMSPEQANGQPLDGRSDLFAVGVMLWEMLTGQSLFPGATIQETLAALFFAPIPAPRQLRADVPEDVSRVTQRLLERDVTLRHATAEEAICELVACGCAPRDGRAELVALMQERFAGQNPTRTISGPPRPAPPPRDPAAASSLAELRRQLGGLTPPVPNPPRRSPLRARSRLMPLLFAGLGALATGSVVVVQRAPSRSPAGPRQDQAPRPRVDDETCSLGPERPSEQVVVRPPEVAVGLAEVVRRRQRSVEDERRVGAVVCGPARATLRDPGTRKGRPGALDRR